MIELKMGVEEAKMGVEAEGNPRMFLNWPTCHAYTSLTTIY